MFRLLELREGNPKVFESFERLSSNSSKRTEHQKNELLQMATLVMSFFQASINHLDFGEDDDNSGRLALHLNEIFVQLCRLQCNNFTICDSDLNAVGHGIYPEASIINHSCQPNAIVIFNKTELILKVIEPIAVGEEITLSYIELASSSKTRQNLLWNRYFFNCKCKSCQFPMLKDICLKAIRCQVCKKGFVPTLKSPINNSNAMLMMLSTSQLRIFQFLSMEKEMKMFVCCQCHNENHAMSEELIGETIQSANSLLLSKGDLVGGYDKISGLLHQFHEESISYHSQLLKYYIDKQEWEKALHFCQQIIEPFEFCYPKYFPVLGLQYFMMGKLYWYYFNSSGALVKAIEFFRKALETLRVTHGGDHFLVLDLMDKLNSAESEFQFLNTCKVKNSL